MSVINLHILWYIVSMFCTCIGLFEQVVGLKDSIHGYQVKDTLEESKSASYLALNKSQAISIEWSFESYKKLSIASHKTNASKTKNAPLSDL